MSIELNAKLLARSATAANGANRNKTPREKKARIPYSVCLATNVTPLSLARCNTLRAM